MSEPRFTITLGPSRQVVKRGGRVKEYAHPHADTKAMTGSKRFWGEKGRSGANNLSSSTRKRQRGDGNWSWDDDGVHDLGISRDDLRLKLMRKSLKRIRRAAEERRKMDQRKKFSKTSQPLVSHNMMHQRSEPTENGISWQMPSMERSRFKASRGLPPPVSFEDVRQVSSVRVADPSRAGWFMNSNATSRPINSAPFTMKGPLENSKPVTQLAPMTSFGQKSSHTVVESVTVDGLLQSLGLGKYNIHFRAEEVDMTALKQMGDKDLKEMGIPMGPRKKILLALLPHSRRRQP
ncbi:hypothetical protein I3843_04G022100 [Carya illinoinensis]|nr:hypothetical protein I3843_04G022100 [Carya illinoinensis]